MTVTPTTPEPPTVTLSCRHAADLADMLRCLSAWVEAEQDQLAPLLDRHDYDIDGLRITLDHYAGLLTASLSGEAIP